MSPTLVFVIPYFGCWPFWMPYFLRSCALNPGVTWLLYSDCGEPANLPANVHYRPISFSAYCEQVSRKTGVAFAPQQPYKLCDIKPALGHVHEEDIAPYDFWGFSDLDLIYGDLRGYFSDDLLARYDLFSSHERRVSGHLCLMRNTEKMRLAYRRAPRFLPRLSEQKHHALDEGSFTRLFLRHKNLPKPLANALGVFNPWRRRALFRELYSTPNAGREWIDGSFNFPSTWYWNTGRITTDITGKRDFPYFHFMGWKRAWKDQPQLSGQQLADVAMADAWCVTEQGFRVLAGGLKAE